MNNQTYINQYNGDDNEGKVPVTNVAIKATDVCLAVGAGAFALSGLACLAYKVRKNKQLNEVEDFKAKVVANIIAEGGTPEDVDRIMRIINQT